MTQYKKLFKKISALCAAAILMSGLSAVPIYASQDQPEVATVTEKADNSYVNWNWTLYELSSGKHEALAMGKSVVDLVVGTEAVVPPGIINEAIGKKIVIGFHTGTGICYSIDGNRIKEAVEPMNLTTSENVAIPEALTTELGKYGTINRKIHMEAASFPVELTLNLAMGKENAGKHANLYRYETAEKKLMFVGSFKIIENGQAAFDITKGGDYVVTVSDKAITAKHEAATIGENDYVVKRGDNLSKIAREHSMTLKELLAHNPQITNPSRIYAGQRITIQK